MFVNGFSEDFVEDQKITETTNLIFSASSSAFCCFLSFILSLQIVNMLFLTAHHFILLHCYAKNTFSLKLITFLYKKHFLYNNTMHDNMMYEIKRHWFSRFFRLSNTDDGIVNKHCWQQMSTDQPNRRMIVVSVHFTLCFLPTRVILERSMKDSSKELT